jgi:hypothetical protein
MRLVTLGVGAANSPRYRPAGLLVARAAQKAGVRRLVLAHIGRPTIRAIDKGAQLSFGEFARDGQIFRPRARRTSSP